MDCISVREVLWHSWQCSSLNCAHAFQCAGLQNNHTSLKLLCNTLQIQLLHIGSFVLNMTII